jgi:hypothetical protein
MRIIVAKFSHHSPVEEGLSGLALAPDIIVGVQAPPIPVPWINLYKNIIIRIQQLGIYNSCIGSESCKQCFIYNCMHVLYFLLYNEKTVFTHDRKLKSTLMMILKSMQVHLNACR